MAPENSALDKDIDTIFQNIYDRMWVTDIDEFSSVIIVLKPPESENFA